VDTSDGVRGDVNVSVVCPFYNEAAIIEASIRNLAANLSRLPCEWELLVVNDGSTDDSAAIAGNVAAENRRIRVLGYRSNKGRGAALLTGIRQARGVIIITTEIDLSWGEDIVHDLLAAMAEHPEADIVVASPHLSGGGYRNVPAKRVWLSRVGNKVIRACMSHAATMNTGMTRAYRREAIASLPLHEPGKEFHLEVILKATALGLRIHEIPAVLEWKDYKHDGRRTKRKSSTRVNRLIVSHSLFSLLANPVRYIWGISFVTFLAALLFFVMAVVSYITGQVAAYAAIVALLLFIVAFSLFVAGIIFKQGNMIQRELWTLQSGLLMRKADPGQQAVVDEDSRPATMSRP
jgi:glycosyltransferase involved in cell wall biosynthesis